MNPKKDDSSLLPLDEQFMILLHKKIMHKSGGAKRRAKKYYMDQYRKTGVIPKPLLLAGKGIMEGRKCSGRKNVLTPPIKKRFVEMVEASCDILDKRFVFISRKGRTIKNYHTWLEDEFKCKISLGALRRYAKRKNLKIYLEKPDFDEEETESFCFKDEPVFDLIQVDGCKFRYFKIRDEDGTWRKPQVIEFYDTGSRFMFILDVYFSESSYNAVDIFSQFLENTAFPQKRIRLRPDQAKGFLNLKRPINELNIEYSLPNGFYLQPDFARANKPEDKVQLETSHRKLHNYETRIIKYFEDRIVKVVPGVIFKKGKRIKIAITYLDIDLEQLRKSNLLETYRNEHNEQKHYFSSDGKITPWIPSQKLNDYMRGRKCLRFARDDVRHFIKYGFDKIKATVGKDGNILFRNQSYRVVTGLENFSKHKSTKVFISKYSDRLFIFEYKEDGILIGEALQREPYAKPQKQPLPFKPTEVERIAEFLENQKMEIDRMRLIETHHKGLTLEIAKSVYTKNNQRYQSYLLKLRQSEKIKGQALFNAFILDCDKQLFKNDYT